MRIFGNGVSMKRFEPLASGTAAEIDPVRNPGVHISLGAAHAGNGHVRQPLLAIFDITEGVHDLHPGREVAEDLPGALVIGQVLSRPRFVRKMEIGGIQDFFFREKIMQLGQKLFEKADIGIGEPADLGIPQHFIGVVLFGIDAHWIFDAPINPHVRPLEFGKADVLAHVGKPFDLGPVELVIGPGRFR